MRIVYNEGPEQITVGTEVFRIGEPKEVDDAVAGLLLAKTSIKFCEVKDKRKE